MTPPRVCAPGWGTGFLARLTVPGELWHAVRAPGLLAGAAFPGRIDWTELAAAGFTDVVCLTHDEPPYDPAPLAFHGFAMQDLLAAHAGPDDPEAERAATLAAARLTADAVAAGRGVLVHCRAGRGRTGTVIGCALVLLGHDPDFVVGWLDGTQRVRNKPGWPEQDWQRRTVLTCTDPTTTG